MKKNWYGYTGVILRVDLTNKKTAKQELDLQAAQQFIGGRGLNLKYLYDEIKPGTDPLGIGNKIIVGTGPCNGTLVPGSQRFTITSKSPSTGFIGDSNSGGDFGAEIKYAGYDLIIIEGRSEKPVYLWIDDDTVELRDATHLWGKTTNETRRLIERELKDPDICVISIGPAGENLVRFGCIMAEIGRGSGRTGMGAVFGSKNLKAIAVRGSRGIRVANNNLLLDLVRKNQEAWFNDKKAYNAWSQWGPSAGWSRYEVGGMLCTRNYQQGTFNRNLLEDLKKYFIKHKACISCPLGCNHSYIIREGPYSNTYGDGIELSTLGDNGPKLGNESVELCLKITNLCNELGVDLFDMTGIIAWIQECYEKGIITEKDVDGLKMEWGNAEAILSLIEMTAYRRGIGDVLAQGIKRAADIIGKGSEKYAMHVKGQALVMREPRASKGWGFGYAVASRGACHMRNAPPEGPVLPGLSAYGVWEPSLLELVKEYDDPTNPFVEQGKAEIVKWFEELRAFQHCLEICIFSYYFGIVRCGEEPLPDSLAKFYNAVTGFNITGSDALKAGERIINLERAFNVREGLTRKDDTLPERMLREPLPDGPAKGQVVDLEPLLNRYYEIRGWENSSGYPGMERLIELGLGDVARELKMVSKVGL